MFRGKKWFFYSEPKSTEKPIFTGFFEIQNRGTGSSKPVEPVEPVEQVSPKFRFFDTPTSQWPWKIKNLTEYNIC